MGRSAVVYVGNGAADSLYENLISEGVFEGEAYEQLGGFFDLCAVQYVIGDSPVVLHNAFGHDCADFVGFTVRRKRNGAWEWYLMDGTWSVASGQPMEKKVFGQGDEFSLVRAKDNETVILVAQWRAQDGTLLNCGYRMYTNTLMAHSFGGMNGKTYHNTMAAFENGIRNGYKYFEVDLSYTTDGRLVLCHGWTAANCKHTGFKYKKSFRYMPYWRLMCMRVHGNRMISARNFYKKIRDMEEYTYEIDFHNVEGEDMEKRMRALEKDFGYDRRVLDRLLIQVYSKEMYEGIGDTSYFKNYQYLVGKNIHNLDDILTYSLDHGICALAVRYNMAKSEYIQKIKNAGLYAMCYTVDKDVVLARNLLNCKVDTLCTDYVTNEMLDAQTKGFETNPFRVFYNAGTADAESHYESGIEGEVIRTKSGVLEYKDMEIWENDGGRCLRKCRFKAAGRRFGGWKMRVRVDGRQLWFCKDGLYHGKGDIVPGTSVEPYLFADQAQIPVWKIGENVTFVMVAVWEKEEG